MDESFTGRPVVTAVAASVADMLRGPLAAGGPLAQAEQVAPLNRVAGHGTGVKGDGAAVPGLNPRPADGTSPAAQAESDGEPFWRIFKGRGAMAPWTHLPATDRWAIVHHLRSLEAK